MKNLLLLSLTLLLGFASCSKSNELVVSSDDVQLVKDYVDEANALIHVAGEIEGNVSAILNTSAVTNKSCEDSSHYIEGGMDAETALLLKDMVNKMGFESSVNIHYWMVKVGKVLKDITKENKKNFDSNQEIMTALACFVIPEITTRNSTSACYKENLVKLLVGTLAIGSKHRSTKDINEVTCSSKGSSFNKIWVFMKNNYECE